MISLKVIAKRRLLVAAVFAANLSILSSGMMEAWTSPVLPKLLHPHTSGEDSLGRPITEDEETWIGALISVGASVGPFIAAFAADNIGRKWTLLALGVPLVASFIMLAFSASVGMIYTARTLSGISIGGVFAVLPTYVAEISEVKIRGMMSTTMNNFEVSGFLLAYVIGPYVSLKTFNIVCALVPLIFLVVFLPMPESPYYLIAKGQKESAKMCLKKLRIGSTDSKVEKELEEIKEGVDQYLGTKYSDIISSRSNIRALVISLALITAQQLSGVNIITFYTQIIFEATGSKIPADISSIIIGGVQVVAAFVTPLIVDRIGRRALLMISAIGTLLSEAPLGLYFYLKDNDSDVEAIYWLPVVCLIVYMMAFNFGFGPLPWTMMSELFPDNMKAIATSLTSFLCWILSFILTKYFEPVSKAIGIGGAFWIFSGFNLLAAVFIFFYVPETKGKTFQEIQNDLQR